MKKPRRSADARQLAVQAINLNLIEVKSFIEAGGIPFNIQLMRRSGLEIELPPERLLIGEEIGMEFPELALLESALRRFRRRPGFGCQTGEIPVHVADVLAVVFQQRRKGLVKMSFAVSAEKVAEFDDDDRRVFSAQVRIVIDQGKAVWRPVFQRLPNHALPARSE